MYALTTLEMPKITKIAKLLVITLCVALVSSCRSKKEITGTPSGIPSEALVQRAVEFTNANRQTAENITAKISLSANAGDKNVSVGGSLKMKRDDVIQISLVALGIMEVGRMELTKEYLMVVDRMGHKYVKVRYADVPFLQQAGIDFYTFQSLFWDELFTFGDKGAAPSTDRFQVTANGKEAVLSNSDSRLASLTFLVSTAESLVKETRVSAVGKEGTPLLTWQYDGHSKVEDKSFPSKMKICINGGKPMEATISLSSIKTDSNWETRTSLSKKYSEITLDVILAKLLGSSI